MDLLDHYLRAVKIYLPRGQRNDIIKELSENLRAQMEEREAELGRPLNESEQEAFLAQHGDPMLVASRYGAAQRGLAFGRQLIGPELFPLYLRIMWLNWGLTIAIFAVVAIRHMPLTISGFFLPFVIQFAVVTVIFILMEILQRNSGQHWTFPPEYMQVIPRWRSLSGAAIWGVAILWWMAVPHAPFLVLGPASGHLKLTQAWQTFFVPILLLLFAGLAQRCVNLARPQWNWILPATRVVANSIGVVLQYFIWKSSPFFVVSPGPNNAERYNHLAQVFNALISYGVLSWLWVYLLVNAVVYAWLCVRHLRHVIHHAREPAPSSIRRL